jgi:chemotaxis response regulator CheB
MRFSTTTGARDLMSAAEQEPVQKRRILVVDDHPMMMREGVISLIGNQTDLEVCGEAETAAEALEKINSLKPDAVADITLPGKSGLELVKDIAVMHPCVSTLVLSMHDEGVYAELRAARGRARLHREKRRRQTHPCVNSQTARRRNRCQREDVGENFADILGTSR